MTRQKATTSTAGLTPLEDAMRKARLGVSAFVDHVKSRGAKQLDLDIMERAQIVDASMDGKVVVEFDADERYANGGGSLHGAAISAIFDCYTCIAFSPLLQDWSVEIHNMGPPGGVSRALNVTYLRPVRCPSKISVSAEVISNGKIATFARAIMTSPDGKKIYATCDHHKVPTVIPGRETRAWTKPKL